MVKVNTVLAVVALSQSLLVPAFAAQQLVTTRTLLVKDPPSGALTMLWQAEETAATNAVRRHARLP